MKTLNQFLDDQMKHEEFRDEYENLQPEFDIIRALVDNRTSRF